MLTSLATLPEVSFNASGTGILTFNFDIDTNFSTAFEMAYYDYLGSAETFITETLQRIVKSMNIYLKDTGVNISEVEIADLSIANLEIA